MDEIGIEQARNQLGEIADRARFTGHATLLTRKGKPAAVIVAADWYEAAISFIGEFRENLGGYEIIHKDGDPLNNDPANLELQGAPVMTIEDIGAGLIGTEFTEAEIPHAVYRLYNAERTLLYVGFTLNLRRRMEGHARDKWWWPQVAHRTMVWYGSEWDARKAEAEAIDAEKPLHNCHGSLPSARIVPRMEAAMAGTGRRSSLGTSADPHAQAMDQSRRPVPRDHRQGSCWTRPAALFRARQEGDHAKYAEILESMRESLEKRRVPGEHRAPEGARRYQ